ncbi:MAG TPA: MoxR family ATPase [Polyangiaceae bacterium]|nr:MoxR family ATPase [Polyangiaceae bacterium]
MTATITFDPLSKAADEARKTYFEQVGQATRTLVPYVYSDEIILAVRVALATDRPLLLRGAPGSGKSTLAEDIAVVTGWRYYEQVVSSRTTAADLQWTFDAVQRLGDAQARVEGVDITTRQRYIQPGVLWWAFDPESARRRGLASEKPLTFPEAKDPAKSPPRTEAGAVVLLDEIDKAEPDMPNDLLVPMGAKRFRVTEAEVEVTAKSRVLLVITTNGERELPPAFLRRCIVLKLEQPQGRALNRILHVHFPEKDFPSLRDETFVKIRGRFWAMVDAANRAGVRPPGTAELIDAVRALATLPEAKEKWEALSLATMWKHPDAPELEDAESPAQGSA